MALHPLHARHGWHHACDYLLMGVAHLDHQWIILLMAATPRLHTCHPVLDLAMALALPAGAPGFYPAQGHVNMVGAAGMGVCKDSHGEQE